MAHLDAGRRGALRLVPTSGWFERSQPGDADAADLQRQRGDAGCAHPSLIFPLGTTLEAVLRTNAVVVKLAAPAVQSGES